MPSLSGNDRTSGVDLLEQSESSRILYGRQTELGVRNFSMEKRRLAEVPSLIRNFALVKLAAARANVALGVLDSERARAIDAAASEIADGVHSEQFPTALVLGGGGTTTNMNFNEVIAARATEIAGIAVHPNDHVNASQSTNDTYPTAMALTVRELTQAPLEAIAELTNAIEAKAEEYQDTTRLGRTCLQDAVTLSVGETHRAQSAALRRTSDQLRATVDELRSIPLGATVLGTGIGAPTGYRERAVSELATLTGRELVPSENTFDSLANLDIYSAVSSAGARLAIAMAKIAADLRLLASGPNGGFAEVTLPAVQAGSSIMPGKINPAIPEYVMQLSYRVRGAATTVDMSVAAGELELNVMEPIIVDSLLNILDDLSAMAQVFREHCIEGLSWNGSRLQSNVESGFDRWVKLAAEEGYDVATQQVREAYSLQTNSTGGRSA